MNPRLLERIALGSAPVTRPVIAPFTGEVLHELPLSTPSDVAAAAAGLRAAQPAWSARPVTERARVILRFHEDRKSVV